MIKGHHNFRGLETFHQSYPIVSSHHLTYSFRSSIRLIIVGSLIIRLSLLIFRCLSRRSSKILVPFKQTPVCLLSINSQETLRILALLFPKCSECRRIKGMLAEYIMISVVALPSAAKVDQANQKMVIFCISRENLQRMQAKQTRQSLLIQK